MGTEPPSRPRRPRHHAPRAEQTPADVIALAALFAASGTLHFLRPHIFEAIVPHRLPGRRALVYASGAAELACAGGLCLPPSRRLAGLASTVLLAAVLPANVQMVADLLGRRRRLATVVAVARLPLQLPLMRIGWRAWRRP